MEPGTGTGHPNTRVCTHAHTHTCAHCQHHGGNKKGPCLSAGQCPRNSNVLALAFQASPQSPGRAPGSGRLEFDIPAMLVSTSHGDRSPGTLSGAARRLRWCCRMCLVAGEGVPAAPSATLGLLGSPLAPRTPAPPTWAVFPACSRAHPDGQVAVWSLGLQQLQRQRSFQIPSPHLWDNGVDVSQVPDSVPPARHLWLHQASSLSPTPPQPAPHILVHEASGPALALLVWSFFWLPNLLRPSSPWGPLPALLTWTWRGPTRGEPSSFRRPHAGGPALCLSLLYTASVTSCVGQSHSAQLALRH